MKKIFTLLTLTAAAVAANAQTESWSIVDDGALKAIYTPNTDANAASVAAFSTTHVSGTQVSGPVAKFIDAEELTDGRLLEDVNNGWQGLKQFGLSADGSIPPFYYVQGNGNPANLSKVKFDQVESNSTASGMIYRANWDESYYLPDGSAGLPSNGTYVTLKADVDGVMKAAVWINKGNRRVFVAKASDAKALTLGTDVHISGYINGTKVTDEASALYGQPQFLETIEPAYIFDSAKYETLMATDPSDANYAKNIADAASMHNIVAGGNQFVCVYFTFNAVANETYYIFNDNTQIGFSGYEFTPSGETSIESIIAPAAADEHAPVYNILGQRVSKDYKGLVIKNGKKYIQK